MNHSRFLDLFWEFSEKLEDFHTLYLDSLVGYELLHERLEKHQDTLRSLLGKHEYAKKEFQDTCSIAYEDLGGSSHEIVSTSPLMKQGELRRRVEKEGKNSQTLSNQIIVSLYSYWEEYLRIEIGKAKGVLSNNAKNDDATRKILNKEVTNDLWGDLRHLRNSIVHNHEMANDKMNKCKLIKWFQKGDSIILSYEMMHAIFIALGSYRNEIHSLSLPKRAFKIPTSSS